MGIFIKFLIQTGKGIKTRNVVVKRCLVIYILEPGAVESHFLCKSLVSKGNEKLVIMVINKCDVIVFQFNLRLYARNKWNGYECSS